MSLDHRNFFSYLKEYVNNYCKKATMSFWIWKLQQDLKVLGLDYEDFRLEIESSGPEAVRAFVVHCIFNLL